MARIRRVDGGRTEVLRARTRVGRSRGADLRIDEASVSGEHALLLWSEDRWVLRDLGSTNGTTLGEARLPPGQAEPLEPDAEIGFGLVERWRVVDLSPPGPLALEGERVVAPVGDLLLLPDAEAPLASVSRRGDLWWLESGEGARPLRDGEEIELEGRRFQLHLPEAWMTTLRSAEPPPPVGELELRFQVSLDEEHVVLAAWHHGREIPLHARSYHYLLLTLARARLEDAADPAQPASEHGWLDVDRLCRMLGADERTVNTWVYRVRRLFAEAGVADPAASVERRKGQMRVGAARLSIARG